MAAPSAGELSAIFSLPPAQAVAFLERKGYRITWDWRAMEVDAHARSFTVAKAMQLDVLADIRAELQRALTQGTTLADFRKQLEPRLRARGWWGKAVMEAPDGTGALVQTGSVRRLQTIYQTNLQSAYMAGRYADFMANAKARPYWQYVAVMDERTRPSHAALNGMVFRFDDPFWQDFWPPNGYNSVVPTQRVSGIALLGLKARYAGKIVEVIGKSGGRFTVTAQHPVLTARGWVDAQHLNKGDQLVAYRGAIRHGAMSADHHENDPPPTIEEAFQALSAGTRRAMPRTSMYLNGEVRFLHGDVEVVGLDRKLVEYVQTSGEQIATEVDLFHASQRLASGAAKRPGVAIDGHVPRRFGGAQRPGLAGMAPILSGDGAARVYLDSLIPEELRQPLPAVSEVRRDLSQGIPVPIHHDHPRINRFLQPGPADPEQFGADESTRLRLGAYGHTPQAEIFIGGFSVNPDALGAFCYAHAGSVEFDQVEDLILRDYCGHVYDLQTENGIMLAYGGGNDVHYAISNCRCRVRALSEANVRERGLDVRASSGFLRQVSIDNPDTGAIEKVAVYQGPGMQTGARPDRGFSGNQGRAAWQPNLDKYPADEARHYVADMVADEPFRQFWERGSETPFPVGVVAAAWMERLRARSQVATLSTPDLAAIRRANPRFDIAPFLALPQGFEGGTLGAAGGAWFVEFERNGVPWIARLAVDPEGNVSVVEVRPK